MFWVGRCGKKSSGVGSRGIEFENRHLDMGTDESRGLQVWNFIIVITSIKTIILKEPNFA